MPTQRSRPEHEATYQDLIKLLSRHGELSPPEMLAVAANLTGKLLAMQDQRTMTRETALKIIQKNIEIGNQQVIAELHATKGSA